MEDCKYFFLSQLIFLLICKLTLLWMDGIFNMIGRITYYCYLGYRGLLGNHLVPSVSLDYYEQNHSWRSEGNIPYHARWSELFDEASWIVMDIVMLVRMIELIETQLSQLQTGKGNAYTKEFRVHFVTPDSVMKCKS